MLAFFPEYPKRYQNLQFTHLNKMTSIPAPFIRKLPTLPRDKTHSQSLVTFILLGIKKCVHCEQTTKNEAYLTRKFNQATVLLSHAQLKLRK